MPAAWDRLTDATQPPSEAKLLLSIIAIGHVHTEQIEALTPHFARIEQLVLEIDPRAPIAKHRAEFNRAKTYAIAGVLLAYGRRSWRRAPSGGPRGIFCGIGVCFDCLVTVNGLPDVRACRRRARDGDVVTTQSRAVPR